VSPNKFIEARAMSTLMFGIAATSGALKRACLWPVRTVENFALHF
jgi:hypothetical protein